MRNRRHRIVLADHARADRLFHLEQLLALALQHPVDRHPGPAADDAGDVVLGHFLAQHRVVGLALRFGKLLFQRRNAAIGKLSRAGEIADALRLFQFQARGIELLP